MHVLVDMFYLTIPYRTYIREDKVIFFTFRTTTIVGAMVRYLLRGHNVVLPEFKRFVSRVKDER